MKRLMGTSKKNRKALKGFTLVEIIVVLVILAILAAAMIPALTGYIDKAKQKTAITEARSVVTAAQTIASEEYAMHGTKNITTDKWLQGIKDDVFGLADIATTANITKVSFDTTNKAKITGLVYTTADGTYDVIYSTASGSDPFIVKDHAGATCTNCKEST